LAARGLGASGAEQKELSRYITGAASQEFGNWQDRLAQLTGVGQTSAEAQAGRQYGAGTTEAGLGLQYALPSAQIYQDLGKVQAESELSRALMGRQNLSSLIGGISNIAGLGLGSIAPYLGGGSGSGSSSPTGGKGTLTLASIAPYI